MYGLKARILHIVGLALFAGMLHADDQTRLDVGAASTNPVTIPVSTPSTIASGAGVFQDFPGVTRISLPQITPEEYKRALKARKLPANLNAGLPTPSPKKKSTSTRAASRITGDTAASGPASIAELARSLKNDPDLIYEYVRNNIEIVPIWGVQKGALGTLLDNQGTAFDQAQLMVSLLREAGYSAMLST